MVVQQSMVGMARCGAIDTFFCIDDDLPLENLPNSLQDVFARMDALHDTITEPEIAKNFSSAPEQLLERVRDSSIYPVGRANGEMTAGTVTTRICWFSQDARL